jgi:hypothetical protein
LLVGVEVGLADRFGRYRICCDAITYSDGDAQELWGGAFDLTASHYSRSGLLLGLFLIGRRIESDWPRSLASADREETKVLLSGF